MSKVLFVLVFALFVTVIGLLVGLLTNAPSSSTYTSSATVGDFWTIEKTNVVKWANVTASTNGMANFTVDEKGLFTFEENSGGLMNAIEIPGYAMVLSSKLAGPNSDQNAVIMGMIFNKFVISNLAGNEYNYMQFRTQNGGCEVGYVVIESVSNSEAKILPGGYYPYGSLSGLEEKFFNEPTAMVLRESDISADGGYATILDPHESFENRFFCSNFGFCVDLEAGSLFGLPAASSSEFNISYAGTYNAILYQKHVTSTNQDGEVGNSTVKPYIITITPELNISISDDLFSSSTLVPWKETNMYADSNWIKTQASECRGLFFANGDNVELFIAFVAKPQGVGCIVSSVHFTDAQTYDYFFGAGLQI